MNTQAGDKWRSDLAQWGIPAQILEQAPESPWIHPPELFQIPAVIIDSPSHQVAREVLPLGGSILDIGCGGGIASFAVTPPANVVIGVDHQPEMLEMYLSNAQVRNVSASSILGFWPEVSTSAPVADVVAAHHVVYNVSNIEEFLLEMDSHANKRTVIEMPQLHPLSSSNTLWEHFWNLSRPAQPSHWDLMNVLTELGFDAKQKLWEGEMRFEADLEKQAHHARIRLCLPASRESEVLDYLKEHQPTRVRKLATIWWDKS